ncbi:MAG TPA: flagellar hook-associated protein FlgL [Oscillospiraceae bacterium]|nr:flagellar hook-associated protein FlgL [Oscillospiraceae bacterium]
MRVTIGMISNQYKSRLNDSLSSLNYYSNRSVTNRRYNKTSEDPFSASQAYKIQRQMQQNADYTSNVEDASDRLSTGQSAMMTINTVAQQVGSTDILQAINGTMSPGDRDIVAKKLRQMQQTIVAAANTKYADQFLFGGSNTSTPPFTVDSATGKLLYRGVDVDTGINTNGASAKIGDATIDFGKATAGSLNGYQLKVQIDSAATSNSAVIKNAGGSNAIEVTLKSGATNADLQTALKNATYDAAPGTTTVSGLVLSDISLGKNCDPAEKVMASASPAFTTSTISNQVNLNDLANEPMYVDLGLGLNFSGNQVNSQSAFNVSMPGISFLGYGTTTTANGTKVSNNMFNLMGTIADKLSSSNFSIDDVQPYIDQFGKSEQNLLGKITESGTKSNFLDYAKTRLQDQSDNLLEKDDNIEYVPSTDAIMDMKMQDYAYRATLQIGTNILQPTILDFMK